MCRDTDGIGLRTLVRRDHGALNIDLLASRLTLASEWIADRAETSGACTAWSTEWLKRRSSRSSLSIGRSEERVGSDAAAASATAVRSGTGADRTDAESSFTDKTIFGSVTGTLIYARQAQWATVTAGFDVSRSFAGQNYVVLLAWTSLTRCSKPKRSPADTTH